MRRISKSKADEEWLRALGRHIEKQILKKGYASVYDFWINKAGDHISRATLNFLLVGKAEPKITTLRLIARLLGVKLSTLLDFD